MKIGLAILNAEPARGGAERYTVDLASSLVERGHDVHLLATRFARNVEPAKQVRLLGAAGTRIARYQQFVDSLDQHLRSTTYDIVHAMLPVRTCDLYHPHAGIEAYNLDQGHLRHGDLIRQTLSRLTNRLNRKRRLYTDVERHLLETHRAAVVCLSLAMQQIAEKYYDLQSDQSFVLLNGVDLGRYDAGAQSSSREEIRAQYEIGPDDVAALLMSNNFRLKGLKQALHALHHLVSKGHRHAKLIVVGREDTDPYRRLAGRLDITPNVIFAGPTPAPETFYAASDLFVLPTAYDSCSLVALESLAMGKPVITTRRNGASEAMTDGVEGFITEDQADTDGLREAWDALLNANLRQKMSQAALALRPRLSKDQHIDRLLAIYQKIRESRA